MNPVVAPGDAGDAGDNLPDFGDSSGSLISPTREFELGREFMRSVTAQVRLVDDPHIHQYIRRLGERLVSHSDAPRYPFTFFVIEDSSVNAFAGPGGYIGVHTGLILAARNESELAGVLAHEIAHVTQRHLLRAYESAQQLSLPTAAATIAALLLGAATGSDAGIAAASAIQAGNIQHQLNFTRANEKEADRIGIQTLERSGFDPYGMPSFFERLYQSTRLYGSASIPEFLSTHPVTSDRIAETMERAAQFGNARENDSTEFQLARARLKVTTANDTRPVLREYAALSAKPDAGPADHYGLALAKWRNGETAAARELLQNLLASDPDRILYRTTLAELQMEAGNPREALQLYKETLALYPGDLEVGEYYASALLRTGQAGAARSQVLDMLRDRQARTPAMYELWGKAARIAGPEWETRQASAELHFLRGNFPLAVEQLEQALKYPELSHYDEARVRARLKEFKAAIEERNKK